MPPVVIAAALTAGAGMVANNVQQKAAIKNNEVQQASAVGNAQQATQNAYNQVNAWEQAHPSPFAGAHVAPQPGAPHLAPGNPHMIDASAIMGASRGMQLPGQSPTGVTPQRFGVAPTPPMRHTEPTMRAPVPNDTSGQPSIAQLMQNPMVARILGALPGMVQGLGGGGGTSAAPGAAPATPLGLMPLIQQIMQHASGASAAGSPGAASPAAAGTPPSLPTIPSLHNNIAGRPIPAPRMVA